MNPAIRGHVSRDALPVLDHLLREEPAILLEGPRGSGKSTLLREIASARDARVVDLDDEAVIAFVQQDPTTALTHPGLVVVDEFQRVPAVLSVVKRIVDRSSEPEQFLLAGSVSSRLLPTGAETLTGRVHRMLLPPLSTAEIVGSDSRLLPTLLNDDGPPRSPPAGAVQTISNTWLPAATRRRLPALPATPDDAGSRVTSDPSPNATCRRSPTSVIPAPCPACTGSSPSRLLPSSAALLLASNWGLLPRPPAPT